VRKLNFNLEEKNEITEEDFNRLIKANLISTSISNSSTDIKKATILFYTPYGLGKKDVSYINLLQKGHMDFDAPDSNQKAAATSDSKEEGGGRWVTIHGKHVKIEDGKITQGNIGQNEGSEDKKTYGPGRLMKPKPDKQDYLVRGRAKQNEKTLAKYNDPEYKNHPSYNPALDPANKEKKNQEMLDSAKKFGDKKSFVEDNKEHFVGVKPNKYTGMKVHSGKDIYHILGDRESGGRVDFINLETKKTTFVPTSEFNKYINSDEFKELNNQSNSKDSTSNDEEVTSSEKKALNTPIKKVNVNKLSPEEAKLYNTLKSQPVVDDEDIKEWSQIHGIGSDDKDKLSWYATMNLGDNLGTAQHNSKAANTINQEYGGIKPSMLGSEEKFKRQQDWITNNPNPDVKERSQKLLDREVGFFNKIKQKYGISSSNETPSKHKETTNPIGKNPFESQYND